MSGESVTGSSTPIIPSGPYRLGTLQSNTSPSFGPAAAGRARARATAAAFQAKPNVVEPFIASSSDSTTWPPARCVSPLYA